MTKSTDYVIASTRSTFVDSPVSFHEQCLPTGAPPGSSRQEFQKEKHSSRTEATAKTLVLKKTTGIRNTGPMELRKNPPRNRQQTPRQTTNYDKTNNRYNRTRSHRSTHQISALHFFRLGSSRRCFEVCEYSSNAKAAQKFKQYKNTRPHSQASMAKWVKTSVTISNPKVIDEFHLTWNPTSKTYVIPRVVRQRNRSITAIQGRKTPAQNTGGNP